MKFIISFLVIIMTSILANAEGLMKESFDEVIAGYQKARLLNADILITKQGKVIYHKKAGFADIEHQKPFNDNSLFPIASLTKQFISVSILLLKDEGKLTLHQPVATYLPEPHPIWQGKMPSWAYDITIHQLLTHSSGLPNFT